MGHAGLLRMKLFLTEKNVHVFKTIAFTYHFFIPVITETLENRGVLGQIKARIRAEVFNSLDDHADSRPPLSNENMIINELIREYLDFNKYKYSASVLVAGTDHGASKAKKLSVKLQLFSYPSV